MTPRQMRVVNSSRTSTMSLEGSCTYAGDAVIRGPALGQDLGEQAQGFADQRAVAVGGEHRQLVDHQQLVRASRR